MNVRRLMSPPGLFRFIVGLLPLGSFSFRGGHRFADRGSSFFLARSAAAPRSSGRSRFSTTPVQRVFLPAGRLALVGVDVVDTQ